MRNDLNLNNTGRIAPVVVLDHVKKTYPAASVTSLADLSLSVEPGEFIVLVGPSGEGKSTALRLIAGLEEPTAGSVTRPKKVAVVFQSVALLPWLTVYENVAFGLRAQKLSEKKIREIVDRHIAMVGLQGLEQKFPRELSGGQASRVGIARALAVEPDVLLMDEPFAALDAKTTHDLHEDLTRIWQETGKTIIMISHIIEEAVSLADRVVLIKAGRVASEWTINLPYPRREQAEAYIHEVQKIRKEFFK